MSIADKLTTIAENVPKVFEAGKNAEYEAFWNEVTSNDTRTQYRYGFAGYGWTPNTFKPIKTIKPLDARYMFNDSAVTSVTSKDVDFSNTTEMRNCFYSCDNLVTLDLKLGTKSKTVNSDTIGLCGALVNVTVDNISFDGLNFSASPLLSKESYENIIGALVNGVGITLSLNGVRATYETSAGANDGNVSPEWLALVETKPNNAISLA